MRSGRRLGPFLVVFTVLSLVGGARADGCPKGSTEKTQEVARGDTLSGLALDLGVSVSSLLGDNPGLSPDHVREGQRLRICIPKPGRRGKPGRRCAGGGRMYEHRVKRGETLSAIAGRYAVDEAALLKQNPSLDGDPTQLRADQALKVCAQPARVKASRACGYRTPLHKHEVIPGEWLAEIASRYGVRQRDMLRLNPTLRKNPDYLKTGSRLRVCPDIPPRTRERIRHTVSSGETLVSIAARYDLNPQQLLRFQRGRLSDPDRLSIGQTLIVWKDGGIVSGFGDEDERGALPHGIQLPPGPGYRIKNDKLAWGAPSTVRLIQSALRRYRARHRSAGRIFVGDLSKRGGGKLPPHKSHQTGEDVDVGYAYKEPREAKHFIRATKQNLDLRGTWGLVQAFLDTDRVRYIFMDYRVQGWLYDYAKKRGVRQSTLDELFQYPRGRGRAYGIIRDDPGHDDHFHVRFQ